MSKKKAIADDPAELLRFGMAQAQKEMEERLKVLEAKLSPAPSDSDVMVEMTVRMPADLWRRFKLYTAYLGADPAVLVVEYIESLVRDSAILGRGDGELDV